MVPIPVRPLSGDSKSIIRANRGPSAGRTKSNANTATSLTMTNVSPERRALPPLTILLAAPRGFCAGVDRAIRIVELALQKFGAPVYVRHEIVHNRHVVDDLKAKGAVFVEELDDIPEIGREACRERLED